MPRNIRDRITDYSSNADDVDKWLRVKGEIKYNEFGDILDELRIELTWKNISDLYRYDKRLLVNNFTYLSFFEEYVRAIILNHSENGKSYEWMHDRPFGELDAMLSKMDRKVVAQYFDCTDISAKLDGVRLLRNDVAHNKIILLLPEYRKKMNDFYNLLPPDYRDNYKAKITGCTKDLDVPAEVSDIFLRYNG